MHVLMFGTFVCVLIKLNLLMDRSVSQTCAVLLFVLPGLAPGGKDFGERMYFNWGGKPTNEIDKTSGTPTAAAAATVLPHGAWC